MLADLLAVDTGGALALGSGRVFFILFLGVMYCVPGKDEMAFYGDQFVPDRMQTFCGAPADAEMTAIVRVYIPEGFMVAADGLKTHSEDPALNIETAQKIIHIDGKGRCLACSSSGVVQITADNSEEIVLDFLKEAKAASSQNHYRRSLASKLAV
jgi:hypothetical protein